MSEPRSLEEWITHCETSGHNACFCHHSLCRDCARAYTKQELQEVLRLGKRFGFPGPTWSVSQVVTHAKHLQDDRARLLFENSALVRERDALLAAVNVALPSPRHGVASCKLCGHTWIAANSPQHYGGCAIADPIVQRLMKETEGSGH